MFSNFYDIPTTNVNHRAANTLRRFNNDVVVLRHVECVKGLDLLSRAIEHTLINSIRDALSLINLAKTRPSLHSSNISKVSVGNGRREPISASPAKTALI
ncbi:hypothetical protein EYC84_001636 [Monilinia fructicola]|uniref:Uncharacterized protein n=1 Tax=Monilinia fructicola TaxID=38448 RepID=A0A5M9JT99_MONFR|nr:hypothetical protein EYC84_001636 [Monilinia fructicola]